MSRSRFKGPDSAKVSFFHCVSRIVDRDRKLGRLEKEKFVEFMRIYERFGGLRVLTFCVMSNHFHILVEVPKRPEPDDLPDDAGLVEKVRGSLGDKAADGLAWELKHLRSLDEGGELGTGELGTGELGTGELGTGELGTGELGTGELGTGELGTDEGGAGGGSGGAEAAEQLRERWFARMWDLSAFMKTLKQRFTQWYNGRHERTGTLWESRFHSVLVQGAGLALRTMTAYIDLNPVRAGICGDPKDYRWSGYGEAVAGCQLASEALAWVVSLSVHGGQRSEENADRKESLRRWRCTLFGVPEGEMSQREELAKGEKGAEIFRKGVSREKALEVLANGGRLSRAEYLRCRVRYFSAGMAIGTKEFVEELFEEKRGWFSPGRKSGARPLRGLAFGDESERLFNMRQLKKNVFG